MVKDTLECIVIGLRLLGWAVLSVGVSLAALTPGGAGIIRGIVSWSYFAACR